MHRHSKTVVVLFQLIMGFIALFHITIGASLMFSIEAQQFFAGLYGAQLEARDDVTYLVRVLGSFALALGVLAVLAAKNPLANRAIGWGFVTLFILRDIQRHLYFSELESGFMLGASSNILTSVFFIAQTIFLIVLLLSLQKISKSS